MKGWQPFIKADGSCVKAGQPMAVLSRMGVFIKIEDQVSGRNGRFINQKRANGQICRFGLRVVDFILPRASSLSAARSSLFRKSWQSQWPPLRKLLTSSSEKLLLNFLLKLLVKRLVLFLLLVQLLRKHFVKLLL